MGKIGDNPFPTSPMSDRAIGYLLQGKAQTAISNYGNIINWDEHPMGIWNGYSYLPSVAFLAGVPGHKYSSEFTWSNLENIISNDGTNLYGVWESSEAFDDWFNNGDTNLPIQCTIKIYTISGELVQSISYDNPSSGNEWWDMRSLNNQEVGPGLYLYHVKNNPVGVNKNSQKIIGKFAVIR